MFARANRFTGRNRILTTTDLGPSTPASASAPGTKGEIVADAGYIYVCTADDTWERVAVATW